MRASICENLHTLLIEATDSWTKNIDGQALMGIEAKGTHFKKKWIFNAELLRQTGKVFESLDYHFQRILLDASYLYLESEGGHLLTAGLAIGQSTGQEYSIEAGTVKANSVSGASYGPIPEAIIPSIRTGSFNLKEPIY